MTQDTENSIGSTDVGASTENSTPSTHYSMPLEGILSYGTSTVIPWEPAASTNTYNLPDTDAVTWAEVSRVSKPIITLVVGWAIGCASGALAVIWMLSR